MCSAEEKAHIKKISWRGRRSAEAAVCVQKSFVYNGGEAASGRDGDGGGGDWGKISEKKNTKLI